MLNRVYGKKFSRNTNARKALFKSLTKELLTRGSIKTTEAKAKAIIADVDSMMNLVREDNLTNRKALASKLSLDRSEVAHYFSELKEAAAARKSGFTTHYALPPRRGDRAKMARISLIKPVSATKVTEKKEEAKEVIKKSKPRGKQQEASK